MKRGRNQHGDRMPRVKQSMELGADAKRARNLVDEEHWTDVDQAYARALLRRMTLIIEHYEAGHQARHPEQTRERAVASALRVDKAALERQLAVLAADRPPMIMSEEGADCVFCEDVTTSQHTWKQCAEVLKARRDTLADYIDSGACEGELVLALVFALKPFAERLADYERDDAECGRYPDDAPLELEGASARTLLVKHLRNAKKAYDLVRQAPKAGSDDDQSE